MSKHHANLIYNARQHQQPDSPWFRPDPSRAIVEFVIMLGAVTIMGIIVKVVGRRCSGGNIVNGSRIYDIKEWLARRHGRCLDEDVEEPLTQSPISPIPPPTTTIHITLQNLPVGYISGKLLRIFL